MTISEAIQNAAREIEAASCGDLVPVEDTIAAIINLHVSPFLEDIERKRSRSFNASIGRTSQRRQA